MNQATDPLDQPANPVWTVHFETYHGVAFSAIDLRLLPEERRTSGHVYDEANPIEAIVCFFNELGFPAKMFARNYPSREAFTTDVGRIKALIDRVVAEQKGRLGDKAHVQRVLH